MTFLASNGSVIWNGPSPVRLSEESVEELLSIFDREHAVRPYLELHDAHVAAGGIPRVSSLRGAA